MRKSGATEPEKLLHSLNVASKKSNAVVSACRHACCDVFFAVSPAVYPFSASFPRSTFWRTPRARDESEAATRYTTTTCCRPGQTVRRARSLGTIFAAMYVALGGVCAGRYVFGSGPLSLLQPDVPVQPAICGSSVARPAPVGCSENGLGMQCERSFALWIRWESPVRLDASRTGRVSS